jgi:hypothetical protein
MRLFAHSFVRVVGRANIDAGLRRAIEIRLDDPNIYPRERVRLLELAER